MPYLHPRSGRLLAALVAALAWPASAHDTWFEPLPRGPGGEWRLALGTGNRFPVHEFAIGTESLAGQGCRVGNSGAVVKMHKLRDAAHALHLRARPPRPPSGAPAGVTCWAQLHPAEIEIEPRLVQVYLDEIAAPPALREAWQQMQARGVKWSERYTKNARVELFEKDSPMVPPAAATPVPMGMDVVREAAHRPLVAGETLVFRVLRDGAPLPGFAIELRNDRAPVGLWLRTDAEGRASVRVPFAGRWCLRGTDLRLSTAESDRWESRFVTFAFQVLAAP